MARRPTAIDLFSGAGGASEGLEQAGFRVVAANEVNAHAASTYRFNHPDTLVFEKDVRKLIAKELKMVNSDTDLLFAGLPCQGFSDAGKKETHDARNYLFKEVIRIARALKPSMVMIENVSGLLAKRNKFILDSIIKDLSSLYDSVSLRMFDASELGLPQRRTRLIILASQDKENDIRLLKYKKSRKVSVEEAIGDLDFLDNGSASEYLKLPRTAYQKRMRGTQKELFNHETSNHSTRVSSRFDKLVQGEVLRLNSEKNTIKKFYTIRLEGGNTAPTITTMPDDYIHYALPRSLTVREMARLQSFRDSYVFLGPRTTGGKHRRTSCPQYTQVGNSVPPLFLNGIVTAIMQQAF